MIPLPPRIKEKHSYLQSYRRPYYIAGILSFLFLAVGAVGFLYSVVWAGFLIPFYATLFSYLLVSYYIGMRSSDFDHSLHKQLLQDNWEFQPTVDIYYATCGEPTPIIRAALENVKALHYTNFKVFVLDDAGDDTVKGIADEFGFNYIARPDRGVLKKAGNLRHAFARTDGEFIFILDADFQVRPDMLDEMMPYMSDPKIALVQTPQYFRVDPNTSWIHKGAAYVQELFYRMIQVNRNHYGASICVGTCALYRRVALEPFGGTAPISYSEDVHTGFNVVDAGYRLVYLPIPLAAGMCPDTVAAFFNQQYRWAMGSLTLASNKKFWTSSLNFIQKVCFLSGFGYYTTTGLGVFIQPIPILILLMVNPGHIFWWSVLFYLPSLLFGTIGQSIWNTQPFGFYVFRSRYISYLSHFRALFDKIAGDLMPWQATGAIKRSDRAAKTFRAAEIYWLFNTLILLTLIIIKWDEYHWWNLIPGCAMWTLQLVIHYSSKDESIT